MALVTAALLALLELRHVSAVDVPGVRFRSDDIGACNPADAIFGDPRAKAWANWLQQTGFYDEARLMFTIRGGTVLIPTSTAIDNFMDMNAFDSPMDALSNTGGNETWAPILRAYYLSNITEMPKDVVQSRPFDSPFGRVMLPVAVYGPTPFRLYMYVGVAEVEPDTFQMITGFVRFLTSSGQGGGATSQRMGAPANMTDWTIACDQYVAYFVEDLPLPSLIPEELQRFGQLAIQGLASTTDFTLPTASQIPANNNGRRLIDMAVTDAEVNHPFETQAQEVVHMDLLD